MTVLDDPLGATPSELSEELIFLIASVSTDDQRKYATELFRYYARQVELDAYRRGQQSMMAPQLPPPVSTEAPGIQPTANASHEIAVSLIPQVRWED
ncbi:hypothetical protein RPMA_25970 [Tardiphaga alba]|uniref:Uncharacterized protein n=1 Tax=Tardiphaga alba TaxID=340268 RepID=A0ABX8AEE8_9BRAD|nr:hypothetical protein [Tardiphaga alba]QUS41897.1 hypothetical protein RPMA_25970 [Tardiphaga alba]